MRNSKCAPSSGRGTSTASKSVRHRASTACLLHRLTDLRSGERWLSPAVFHCLGGKDRTGLAAALLLSWLGVDRGTVLYDYELSARCAPVDRLPVVVDRFVANGMSRPAAEALVSVPRWAMAKALELVDAAYGGIESFLRGLARMTATALEHLRLRLVC